MLIHESITSRIIGAAFRVHNSMGPGFTERIYCNALHFELRRLGLSSRVQVPLDVAWEADYVGTLFADLIVEDKVVVETKAQEDILPGHLAQVGAYLRTSGHTTGLVVNFGPVKVSLKRVIETANEKKEEKAG